MAINHNQAVYIPKGEHDDPHELPQQCNLEGLDRDTSKTRQSDNSN